MTFFKSPTGKQAIMDYYDMVMAGWQATYETQMVKTRMGDTFVIKSGNPSNPPLILLHGATSNACSWASDVADYVKQYCVYAIDTVGEPGKSAETRIEYDGIGFVEWLDDVLSALNLQSVTLVGLSQGGWIALKYAITYPERVSALVLLTPNGITTHNELFFLKMLPLFFLGKWGQKRAVQMMFADLPVPEGAVEGTAIVMRHYNARRERLPLFTDDELIRLTMPIVLMGGEKDGVFDVKASASRLEALIPNVQTHIIPGAGHAIVQTASDVMRLLVMA